MKTMTIRLAVDVSGMIAARILRLIVSPSTVRAAAVIGGGWLLSVGAGQIYPPAGYIVGGALLLIAGLAGHLRGAAGG